MDKIIVIDKKKGYTSRDIVNILTKKLNTKKIGHFGTLDPLATGILVMGIGRYTKLCNNEIFNNKTYLVEVKIGIQTDTFDITGKIIKQAPLKDFDINKFKEVLYSYKKTYLQEVPIYSAVKINGKKLLSYAKENIQPTLPKKEVTIYNINFISYKNDLITFEIDVSKGTYIRSLVNDISKDLNYPLTVNNLRRTKQGCFTLKDVSDYEHDNYNFKDIIDITKVTVKQLTKDKEKEILNGVKQKQEKEDEDLILWKKNDQNIFLYKKDKTSNYTKPYICYL